MIPRAKLKSKLREIEQNPEVGKPLTGPLKGCRRIRVGDKRIVYRTLVSEDDGEDVYEVIAIGKRRDEEVYGDAQGR